MIPNQNRADSCIQNIAKEIVKECNLAGKIIRLDVASYLVRLKLLDPMCSSSEDVELNRNIWKSVAGECVQDFLNDAVWINTIKLQAFSENVTDRAKLITGHNDNILKKLMPLIKGITDVDPSGRDGRARLYEKMVEFTVWFSGLGNPAFKSVLQEAHAAFQSILKFNELQRFIELSRVGKEEQLIEFARIVNGIRLFNKDCQKGGEGIEDLPSILTEALQITKGRIITTLDQLKERLRRLTTTFEDVYSLSKKTPECYERIMYNLPSGFTVADLDEMKRIFFMTLELVHYKKKLLVVIEHSISSVTYLIEKFRKVLIELHELVRYRSAVPTALVYPLFIALSQLWEKMQQEASILNDTNTFMANLHSLNKHIEPNALESALIPERPVYDTKINPRDEAANVDSTRLHIGVRIIASLPGDSPGERTELQYRGYCAWTIAVTDGLLIPGSPDIGFMQYKNRIYSFSSIIAANAWGENPDRYITDVYTVVRAKLELIKILGLYDDLCEIGTETLTKPDVREITRTSVEIQTDIHPIPKNIDRNYSFSLWELRSKALKMSEIVNYKTKSLQTVNGSHFRTSIGLQVNPVKAQASQTMSHSSNNYLAAGSYLLDLGDHQG